MHFIACYNSLNRKGIEKILLIMKLTTAFLFGFSLLASAGGFSQNINLSEKNARLEEVFRKIKNQTEFTFAYTKAHLQKSNRITVVVHDASLKEVLDFCFKDQPLE